MQIGVDHRTVLVVELVQVHVCNQLSVFLFGMHSNITRDEFSELFEAGSSSSCLLKAVLCGSIFNKPVNSLGVKGNLVNDE